MSTLARVTGPGAELWLKDGFYACIGRTRSPASVWPHDDDMLMFVRVHRDGTLMPGSVRSMPAGELDTMVVRSLAVMLRFGRPGAHGDHPTIDPTPPTLRPAGTAQTTTAAVTAA